MRWFHVMSLAVWMLACGADTPVPDYPFPAQPVLEETELAEVVEPTAGGEAAAEEETWDDGLDAEMGSLDGSAPAVTPTPAPAPAPAPAP